MPSMRPLSRPTIRELAAFLLPPPSPQSSSSIRCLSHLPRASRPVLSSTSSQPQLQHTRRPSPQQKRALSSPKPASRDRGPRSEETTQTDFGTLDVLGGTPAPSTSIDACLWDGFHLDSGVKLGGGTGVLLVGGEAFAWRPWEAGSGEGMAGGGGKRMVNGKGQWDVANEAWGVLGLVWPKPDLLILGLGKDMRPISPRTRQFINSLGIRVDIQDTRNAAAQFNLLATERGISTVAAALVPMGWREGVGVVTADG